MVLKFKLNSNIEIPNIIDNLSKNFSDLFLTKLFIFLLLKTNDYIKEDY